MPEPIHLTPRAMLETLVGFATVSRDSNLSLIEFVVEYLASHGVSATLVHSDCGTKANLFASIGPQREGGVVLSGHTDVVPIDGQDWHTDPFTLTERDGLLYGRGTCDMKGFYANALALVPQMQGLRYPIHFALSYDEEIGCLGAPKLIAALSDSVPQPQAVIVGEPTMMNVVTAHKGILHFDTTVTGFEAHSSLQHIGVSAVMVAAKLINWLGERQSTNARHAPTTGRFEPGYTTIHCGMVKGGTAANIMAKECTFVTDVRAIPGEDPRQVVADYQRFIDADILPQMQAVNATTAVAVDVWADVPGYQADDDCPAVLLAKRLTGQNESLAQPYAAESGQFQNAGFATVMCGPGSIEQAHQPNEFISVEQLQRGETFVRRLIESLSKD